MNGMADIGGRVVRDLCLYWFTSSNAAVFAAALAVIRLPLSVGATAVSPQPAEWDRVLCCGCGEHRISSIVTLVTPNDASSRQRSYNPRYTSRHLPQR